MHASDITDSCRLSSVALSPLLSDRQTLTYFHTHGCTLTYLLPTYCAAELSEARQKLAAKGMLIEDAPGQQGAGDNSTLYLESVRERQAELDAQGKVQVQKNPAAGIEDDPTMPALEKINGVADEEEGDLNGLD